MKCKLKIVNFAIVAKINAKENGKIVVLLFLFFSIQKHCKAWSIIFQQFSASLPGWMKEILRFKRHRHLVHVTVFKSSVVANRGTPTVWFDDVSYYHRPIQSLMASPHNCPSKLLVPFLVRNDNSIVATTNSPNVLDCPTKSSNIPANKIERFEHSIVQRSNFRFALRKSCIQNCRTK